ncbi:hypothetical protein [Acinetobacter cumulans]|uniref:hypothetical protein n=1 Tax=Acinetobacter cumulans TaxID=2136182 RepID=UPI00148C9D18|nr:hypothetical protein [Acinetobacter cumulans]
MQRLGVLASFLKVKKSNIGAAVQWQKAHLLLEIEGLCGLFLMLNAKFRHFFI